MAESGNCKDDKRNTQMHSHSMHTHTLTVDLSRNHLRRNTEFGSRSLWRRFDAGARQPETIYGNTQVVKRATNVHLAKCVNGMPCTRNARSLSNTTPNRRASCSMHNSAPRGMMVGRLCASVKLIFGFASRSVCTHTHTRRIPRMPLDYSRSSLCISPIDWAKSNE